MQPLSSSMQMSYEKKGKAIVWVSYHTVTLFPFQTLVRSDVETHIL